MQIFAVACIQNHHGNDTSLKRQDGLYFLSKLRLGDDRRFVQRTLEVIAGLLQCILPQFVNVQRILHARVPIVKFSHVATGIDCDVCLENEYVLYAVLYHIWYMQYLVWQPCYLHLVTSEM